MQALVKPHKHKLLALYILQIDSRLVVQLTENNKMIFNNKIRKLK